MKKVLLLLLGIIPMLISAQNDCVYFDEMVKLTIEKTDINTSQSDFGATFVGNELFYSAYNDEKLEKLEKGKTRKIYYDGYTAVIDDLGNIQGSRFGKLSDIGKGYHVGPASYCEKTGELFVTINNYDNPAPRSTNMAYQKEDLKLKVIVMKNMDGAWSRVADLPFNNPEYSVGHPTVTSTGDTLYFASDIPNKGFGGTDIYRTIRSADGTWGAMENMGDKINTAGNEMFPFIYKDKMLIYATNGKKEGDDLDIYHVGLFGENMTNVTEVKQLNSSADDFGFVIHKEEEVGYFVSNRSGGEGDDDIYKVLIEKIGKYELELIVMDRGTNERIENAKIGFGDLALVIEGFIFKRVLEKDKSYVVKTNLEGYQNESKTITTVGKPFGVIRDTLWVEKVKPMEPIVLENIYYDFDKWNILPESEIELNKLVKIMNDNPSWKVELGSHTDCRGSDRYHEILSQRRSDSAVGYIVDKGISKSRIVAKGYGETQLVNHCDDGVWCTPADHRKNRRTTFMILEMDK
jgi:outer membrane protein OmpA-like peptidoglycan-associated protein